MKKLKKLFIFLLILAILVGVNYLQNRSFVNTVYHISSQKLPDAFEGFVVVQVSDLHMIADEKEADKLYKLVEKQSPDIIAITGDLVDSTKYIEEENILKAEGSPDYAGLSTAKFASRLTKIAPTYFVYGNHEMILLDDPEENRFKCALEDYGIVILNNDTVELKMDGAIINLMGLQDPATLYKDPVFKNKSGTSNDIMDAQLSVVTKSCDMSRFTLALSHRPEKFRLYEEYGLDVVLTGHAHGGQVRIPFVREGLYAPNQGFFPDYTAGVYTAGETSMVVSRGLGNSVIPVRIFNTPELVTVILTNTGNGDNL